MRHGYDGIDCEAFHQLVRVHVAGKRYLGWIQMSEQVTRDNVAEMASYRRPAWSRDQSENDTKDIDQLSAPRLMTVSTRARLTVGRESALRRW